LNKTYLFTSESVTEGHPDKIADQISDNILDEILKNDPMGRVACETLVTTGMVMISGEITTDYYVDFSDIVRSTIKNIGYTDSSMGFDWKTCAVISSIDKQSVDIARGVDIGGAGDQGLMFGYACKDTDVLMPLPIYLAHTLTERLSYTRKSGILNFLRPDGKSQVTVEYENGIPTRIDSIVIACQHSSDIENEVLKEAVIEEVIKKVIPKHLLSNTTYYINQTGRFVIGGPMGDCGLTGRKIIADTYGGFGRHGGGAFSGKDPSKVDRSASYMCRYIAKNLVDAGLTNNCEVQVSYVIGKCEPTSIQVFSNGVPNWALTQIVKKEFNLIPKAIIEKLDLRRPIYGKTSNYGHFGRELEEFTWEKTDMREKLSQYS